MFVLPVPGAKYSPLSLVHQGQSHLQLLLSGILSYSQQLQFLSSPKKWGFPVQKILTETSTHSQQPSPETSKAVTRGWEKKKDQVFLSEQQLSSCTWSPAAIFNKMLLFNIVYCQQPMVIFSWTMHTQASKSLSLSLKLGRIFQELHNDITSLPLPTAHLSQQQHPLKYVPKSLGDTATQNSLYSWVFLTEKVICTNKSLICILRNPSIKPTKGQWI